LFDSVVQSLVKRSGSLRVVQEKDERKDDPVPDSLLDLVLQNARFFACLFVCSCVFFLLPSPSPYPVFSFVFFFFFFFFFSITASDRRRSASRLSLGMKLAARSVD
jgi:hypothetical protein